MSDQRNPLVERLRALCSQELEPEATGESPRLVKLEGIRALLFDVYGTLMVSGCGDIGLTRADTQKAALERALEEVGFTGGLAEAAARGADLLKQCIEEDHARRRQQGVDFPEVEIRAIWQQVIERLQHEQLLDQAQPAGLAFERLAIEYECRVNPVAPMPGALEVIENIRGRGLGLGIISNAQFFTPLLFETFFHRTVEALGFEEALCGWSYKCHAAKPSTRLFNGILEKLQELGDIRPSSCLYVGNDMLNDIWTAARVGCKTALFAGDLRSLRWREGDERVADTVPDLVITDLRQLLECV